MYPYIIVFLFLVYISQPAIAMSFNIMNEMTYCTNSEMQENQNKSCCEKTTDAKEDCGMEDCQCDLAISMTSFTVAFKQ